MNAIQHSDQTCLRETSPKLLIATSARSERLRVSSKMEYKGVAGKKTGADEEEAEEKEGAREIEI